MVLSRCEETIRLGGKGIFCGMRPGIGRSKEGGGQVPDLKGKVVDFQLYFKPQPTVRNAFTQYSYRNIKTCTLKESFHEIIPFL